MTPPPIARPPSDANKVFLWQAEDARGRALRGELRARDAATAVLMLRRQGLRVLRVQPQKKIGRKKITEKDITLLTRQLATMLKAGVPLLQSFEIMGRGHAKPAVSRLLSDLRTDVETGTSLSQAFRRHPSYFDALFCNLVAAGEQAGLLDDLLARLATYREKTLAIKSKIRGALVYPAAVMAVAMLVTAVIMIWVVPSFKSVFESFGAELPLPTLMVIWVSDRFVDGWPMLLLGAVITGTVLGRIWRRTPSWQAATDRMLLRVPVLGEIVRKSVIARWTRTLATLFAAGVPLVESLDSVGGACGNAVYHDATQRIGSGVRSGSSLNVSMQETRLFPPMVTQMVAIGEESGALDAMLGKVAEFYEEEVDAAVASLSSLMEPVIMVILGGLIGGLVIAMYLPIFKLGSVF